VRLWALADGACLRTFEGHAASVLRVAFISAGTQACLRPALQCEELPCLPVWESLLLVPVSRAAARRVLVMQASCKTDGDHIAGKCIVAGCLNC